MNTNLVVPGELNKNTGYTVPRNQNYPLDKLRKRKATRFFIFNQTGKLPCKKTTGMWQFIFFSLSFLLLLYYCAIVRSFYFSCSTAKRERLFFFPFSAGCIHHSLNGQLEFHSINVIGHYIHITFSGRFPFWCRQYLSDLYIALLTLQAFLVPKIEYRKVLNYIVLNEIDLLFWISIECMWK